MKQRNLLLCALLGVMAISVNSCSGGVNNDKLVIGLECAYQPFNWEVSSASEHTLPIYGSNRYADGFDIAIAKYLSKDLNKEVVIKKIEWGALVPSLQNGEINMILAGMSSTEERRQTIDFTNPYLKSDLAFLIKKEHIPAGNSKTNPLNYEGLLDLFDNKSLICQMSVAGDDIIASYFANNSEHNIRHDDPLATYPLAAMNVAAGISFAMPAELPVVEAMTNIDASLGVLYCDYSFLSASSMEGLSVNIGIKKGNDELRNLINESLARLGMDGCSELMAQASLRSGNN